MTRYEWPVETKMRQERARAKLAAMESRESRFKEIFDSMRAEGFSTDAAIAGATAEVFG